jgi:hypothetical protein
VIEDQLAAHVAEQVDDVFRDGPPVDWPHAVDPVAELATQALMAATPQTGRRILLAVRLALSSAHDVHALAAALDALAIHAGQRDDGALCAALLALSDSIREGR